MFEPFVLLVGIGIVSILCQLFAYKVKLPAILPLLIAGIVLGPVTGVLNPDDLFGDLLFPFISLSVAIILFEGALTLKLEDLRGHGKMVTNLCSYGALITWFVAAPAAHFALGLNWELSLLFGAIITVTGPTVIKPMLRSVRPTGKVARILQWEGIIIDPIGALLAVLVYEYIVSSQQDAVLHTLRAFGLTIAVGAILGVAGGHLLGVAIRKKLIPHYLTNPAVLTIMLGLFALSDELAHESGLLTVTVMGMWMANMKNLDVDAILEFKETLSVLLISALFILLAARLDFQSILQVGTGALIVLGIIIFVARPLSIFASALGTDISVKEKLLLSWIAPRGIVAAAVSALFAIKLEDIGYASANILVPMVFLVIITTVVLQSFTAARLAKFLKLRAPHPNGILIFGASPFARMLAKELIEKEIPVRIADTNWDSIRQARMANIPVYYGNPASEHAHRTMDLSVYGKVMILSPYRQLNPVVTYHFEAEFGQGAVFGLDFNDQENRSSHQISEEYSRKLGLFSEGATYAKLSSLVAQGATIKTTPLSESFTFDDYKAKYGDRALLLCAIEPPKRLYIFTIYNSFKPKADWQIISLISPEKEPENKKPNSLTPEQAQ